MLGVVEDWVTLMRSRIESGVEVVVGVVGMLWGVNAEGANDSGAGVGFKKIAHWNKGEKEKTAQLSHDGCSAQERPREWRGESWVLLCRLQL